MARPRYARETGVRSARGRSTLRRPWEGRAKCRRRRTSVASTRSSRKRARAHAARRCTDDRASCPSATDGLRRAVSSWARRPGCTAPPRPACRSTATGPATRSSSSSSRRASSGASSSSRTRCSALHARTTSTVASPTRARFERCARYVSALVETLDPAIVVTLGATALESLHAVAPHSLALKWDVGDVHRWNGRFVLPLYHPGARAMIQRSWAEQRRDYKLLRSLLGEPT